MKIFVASRIAILLLVLAAGWIIYLALNEAYGAGPPYYAMTTNMDKWSSPWPLVSGTAAACLLICWVLGKSIKRP